MKYDDAEFCFLNFETELDNNAANTHIGMYLAWAVLRGLGGDARGDERWARECERLRRREITGGQLLSDLCDCKLTDWDLNAEGNAFTAAYYESTFAKDYERALGHAMPKSGHPTDDFCSVPDTWENFDRLAPLLDRRLAAWRAQRGPAAAAGDSGLALQPLAASAPAAPPAPPKMPEKLERDESIESLQKRAATGDGDAWYRLAAAYLTGDGVERDFAKAADAFEKAAQAGVPEAAYNLGVCYQNGDGRPADPAQMLRWFAFAAEGGHGQAAYMMATAYRRGKHVRQDLVASNALMLIAKARGVKAAAEAGLMAGSLPESFALAAELQAPGQLVAVLAARRRAVAAGRTDDGVARFHDPADIAGRPARQARAAGRAVTQTDDDPDDAGTRDPGSLGFGHLALLVGAVALIPLMMLAPGGRSLRYSLMAWALSLTGAFGVFAVGGGMGWSVLRRTLFAAVAAWPFIGSFVCMGVGLNWAKARRR